MEKPDIGINYPNIFPENFGETITSEIIHERLNLAIRREEPKIWGSWEWAIPGIIAIYIFKPYFESFLKEAGKDHYNLLKSFLSKILKLNKDFPTYTITSESSPEKIDKKNTQSKAISIHIELKDERRIKLLFDTELEIEVWTSSLISILNLVEQYYLDHPNDELTLKLGLLEKNPRFEIIAIINNETKEWEFLDHKMIYERIRKEKK